MAILCTWDDHVGSWHYAGSNGDSHLAGTNHQLLYGIHPNFKIQERRIGYIKNYYEFQLRKVEKTCQNIWIPMCYYMQVLYRF